MQSLRKNWRQRNLRMLLAQCQLTTRRYCDTGTFLSPVSARSFPTVIHSDDNLKLATTLPSQQQAPVSAVHCRHHPVLFIMITTGSHSCTTRGYTAHHKQCAQPHFTHLANSVTDNGRATLSSWITHRKSISIWHVCVVKLIIRGLNTVRGSVCCGPRHSHTHKQASSYCMTSSHPEFIHALFIQV